MYETQGEEVPETGTGWTMDELVIPSSSPFEDNQSIPQHLKWDCVGTTLNTLQKVFQLQNEAGGGPGKQGTPLRMIILLRQERGILIVKRQMRGWETIWIFIDSTLHPS